jgi:hypothetical protein
MREALSPFNREDATSGNKSRTTNSPTGAGSAGYIDSGRLDAERAAAAWADSRGLRAAVVGAPGIERNQNPEQKLRPGGAVRSS